MKILNLYAGIGGNRKLWGDTHDITAVELNPQIAKIYQDFFPKDKVIVADAHQYLLEHFKEFEFIWSSPPCPSHSRMTKINYNKGQEPEYPDMKLYQEIILLKYWFKGKFCIENVISYYTPLIHPRETRGHYFWCNFHIKDMGKITKGIRSDQEPIANNHFNIDNYKINKAEHRQILNNCVEPELGLHILNESQKNIQAELFNQGNHK